MRWLLQRCSLFRSVEADLAHARSAIEELSAEKALLEERLDLALSDKAQLWRQMQDALDNERNALRMQINHAVQRSGGGIPYPDAHSLPANAAPPIQEPGPAGRRGRILASEVAAQRTHQFMEEVISGRGIRA